MNRSRRQKTVGEVQADDPLRGKRTLNGGNLELLELTYRPPQLTGGSQSL